MTGKLHTADHRTFQLPPLLSWRVNHTGTVPCDSFSVTFVYQKEMAQPLRMAAGFTAEEGGQVMLRAVVDEYTVDLDSTGLTATVTGRGCAARLLDNESRPVTYERATLAEILDNHVTPYGVDCAAAAELRAGSVYTVAAGSSQWKAVEGFCRTYGGFSPRFSREGELLAVPEEGGEPSSPVLLCEGPGDDRPGRTVPPGDVHAGTEHLGRDAVHGGISDPAVQGGRLDGGGDAAGELFRFPGGPGGGVLGADGAQRDLPGGGGGEPLRPPGRGDGGADIEAPLKIGAGRDAGCGFRNR